MKLRYKKCTMHEFIRLAKTNQNNFEVDLEDLLPGRIKERPSEVLYLKDWVSGKEKTNVFMLKYVKKDSYLSTKIPDTTTIRRHLLSFDTEENPLTLEIATVINP